MNHTAVINKINDLNMRGFKEAYLRQMDDVGYHSLSFEDRIYNLLDAQELFLKNKKIQISSTFWNANLFIKTTEFYI